MQIDCRGHSKKQGKDAFPTFEKIKGRLKLNKIVKYLPTQLLLINTAIEVGIAN